MIFVILKETLDSKALEGKGDNCEEVEHKQLLYACQIIFSIWSSIGSLHRQREILTTFER